MVYYMVYYIFIYSAYLCPVQECTFAETIEHKRFGNSHITKASSFCSKSFTQLML